MSEGAGMFSAFERMVAMRYLRTRRREGFISIITWLSLVGIALGVAALIIVMSVMNGMREELLSRVLGFNGHIIVRAAEGPIADPQAVASALRRIEGVAQVTPTAEGHVLISGPGGAGGAVLRGVPPEVMVERGFVGASAARTLEPGTVIPGSRLSYTIGARPGQTVTLTVPQVDESGRTISPRARGYRVATLFTARVNDFDARYVLAPLSTAQQFLGLDGGVSYVEVFVDDLERLDAVKAAVARALGPGLAVTDWRERNSSLFAALQTERKVTFLLLTLIVVVAAFNIASSLIMLVKEKGRDIAILRTMGATRGTVMRVFFMAGASIGIAGTVIGVGLGLTLATNVDTIRALLEGLGDGTMFANEIRFLAQLPSRVEYAEVAAVAATALLLSFAATLFPAWRAARLDPVEALRYE